MANKYKELYAIADVQYDEAGYRKYRRFVDSNPALSELENEWAETFFTPIVDFMGTGTNQTVIFNGEKPAKNLVISYASSGRKSSLEPYQIESFLLLAPRLNRITGVGEGHFRARRPGPAEKTFDPYDKYQKNGSNQFCQTYSLMYLIGRIPYDPPPMDKYTAYYKNTNMALQFIQEMIKKYGSKLAKQSDLTKLNKCLKELTSHPNMCFNVPE